MRVFLDTEFSNLNNPDLISVGLIDEAGRALYFELNNIGPSVCSQFVREVVWPLLDGPRVSLIRATDLLQDYFSAYPDGVEIWTDAPRYDIELLRPFLRTDLRFNIAVPSFENDRLMQRYQDALEKAFQSGLRRHHALDDAIAARMAWQAVNALSAKE